jgi:N-acetylglucosaminyl-diphospho-decaprenol L-rhamnosyltransferase
VTTAPRPTPPDTAEPGIVIITMNRANELARTLDVLVGHGRVATTVVVDNGSTDGTSDILRRHDWVHRIPLGLNLGGAARNLGVRALDTEFVAFLDDDTWPEPDALRRAVSFLRRHPDVAIVAAHVLVEPGGRVDPICSEMARGALGRRDGGFQVAGFLAGASIVRSEALVAVGGFHRAFGVGGEEELVAWDLLDAGWSLVYVPDVVVHHHPSKARDPVQRAVREARNRVWSAWMRRSAKDAARHTLVELRTARRTGTVLALTRAIGRGIPMVVAERRRLRPSTEHVLRALQR